MGNLFVKEWPMEVHLGYKLREWVEEFYNTNAFYPKRIILDVRHFLAFTRIYTPNVIPGEDIKDHKPVFHGVPVAMSKNIEGIILEE